MPTLEPGAALGASYRLHSRIGVGAAGDVWRIESRDPQARLAAKILKTEHANDPMIVERFVRERSVLTGLRHENIVAVRDLVVEGDTLAIVMDYIPGGSLRDVLRAHGSLPAADALSLTAQIFDALEVAHRQQIIHRDIKPDNVLLSKEWSAGSPSTVMVTDFGIAGVVSERQSQSTGIIGTPRYMAPELISHGHTSPAIDVYAAGILLYELLAGRSPFEGPGTDYTVAYRHVNALPPRLELPGDIWDLLESLLSKDPRQRPSAGEAATLLLRLAAKHPDLPALDSETVPDELEDADRPGTVLRSELFSEPSGTAQAHADVSDELPQLAESHDHTMLRPRAALPPAKAAESRTERDPSPVKHAWLTRRNVIIGAIALILTIALALLTIWLMNRSPEDPEPDEPVELQSASQQDMALPTGLTIARSATVDAGGRMTLEITYTAQRAPLSGPFLEIIPPLGEDAPCPVVTWSGTTAARNQQSITGVPAECGWALADIEVPANGQTTVTAEIQGELAEGEELNEWLSNAAAETSSTTGSSTVMSTAYPVQRLQDIEVVTPDRMVSETTIPITLVPVWPNGPDGLNPLYQSPATGQPTAMLTRIAGGEQGVRFSDSCAGALAISADGLVVTTLSMATECTLYAAVGNFTSLVSPPFSITVR